MYRRTVGAVVVVLGLALAQPLKAGEPDLDKFWSKGRIALTAVHAGAASWDVWTTRRGLKAGLHERNPILRPLVNGGAAGQAGVVGLSLGIDLGLSYLVHKLTRKGSKWRIFKWEMPVAMSAAHGVVGVYNYRLVNGLQ